MHREVQVTIVQERVENVPEVPLATKTLKIVFCMQPALYFPGLYKRDCRVSYVYLCSTLFNDWLALLHTLRSGLAAFLLMIHS